MDNLSSLSDSQYRNIVKTLAGWVIEQRERRGWSQAMLADKSGLSRSDVNAIEHGRVTLPGAAKRRALASALGVSHEALLVAAGELLPEEASRPIEPRRFGPESGHEAVLSLLDRMSEEEAHALARTGEIILELRRPRSVSADTREEVPALG